MSQVIPIIKMTPHVRLVISVLITLNAAACFWLAFSFIELSHGHPAAIIIAIVFSSVIFVDGVVLWTVNK